MEHIEDDLDSTSDPQHSIDLDFYFSFMKFRKTL